MQSEAKYSDLDKLLAWSVHLFTASGSVWGFLAIVAIIQHQWQAAFLWMGATALVDGLDGSLARIFRVKGVTPNFDGALLDNIIDYETYVVIPALFVYEYVGLMPKGWELIGAILIVLSSAYQFCQTDAKTEDHFFKGFPSYWNVVVLYLFYLGLNGWINFAVIALCAILVFVPVKFIYPSRMSRYQRITLILTGIWSLMQIFTLLKYPDIQLWVVWVSLLYLVYYTGMSFYLSRPKMRQLGSQ